MYFLLNLKHVWILHTRSYLPMATVCAAWYVQWIWSMSDTYVDLVFAWYFTHRFIFLRLCQVWWGWAWFASKLSVQPHQSITAKIITHTHHLQLYRSYLKSSYCHCRITTWIESLTPYLNLYIIIIYDIMITLIVFYWRWWFIENGLWFQILLFLFSLL